MSEVNEEAEVDPAESIAGGQEFKANLQNLSDRELATTEAIVAAVKNARQPAEPDKPAEPQIDALEVAEMNDAGFEAWVRKQGREARARNG